MLLRLTVLCHLTCAALALQYLYDETIWTKQTWSAYKLPFPARKILQAAEHKTALNHVSDLGPFSDDSYPQTYAGYVSLCQPVVPQISIGSQTLQTGHVFALQKTRHIQRCNSRCGA